MQNLLRRWHIVSAVPLKKGWSRDEKQILTTASGLRLLLRLSPAELLEKKQEQFSLLQQLEAMALPASRPLEIGQLPDGRCYLLLTWLEGEDAAEALGQADKGTAYALGLEAGAALQKLHSLPLPPQPLDWWDKIQSKAPKKIQALLDCGLRIPMQETLLEYYQSHMELMRRRPQVFCHSDYHLGNLIVSSGKIGIIDFDKCTAADPYDDFKPFCWNVMGSPFFETGLINGYFDGRVPEDFFPILKYYTVESLISRLPWSLRFGAAETAAVRQVEQLQLQWWDTFRRDVPTWYRGVL